MDWIGAAAAEHWMVVKSRSFRFSENEEAEGGTGTDFMASRQKVVGTWDLEKVMEIGCPFVRLKRPLTWLR